MKCAICVAEGERSTISVGIGMTMPMGGVQQSYDEDGILRTVDHDIHTMTYRCSRGHDGFATGTEPVRWSAK